MSETPTPSETSGIEKTSDESHKRSKPNAAIIFILLSVLLDVLSFGVLIPIVPNMIREFTHGDEADASFYVGLFGTVWAAMQFFCAPILGALSDRYGRRPIILFSCFGLGLDYILIGSSQTLMWLFVGRVISGITASGFATAGAYIADVTPPEKRSVAYGYFGAAFGIGFTLGPGLGGYLGSIDLRLPCWVAAGMTIINACYGYFILPESLPKNMRRSFSWRRANPIGSLHLLRSYPGLISLASVYFLYQLAHQVLNNIFVLYTGHRFAWSPSTVGFTLMFVGILSIVVQGGLVRPALKLLGQYRMMYVGLMFGATGYFLYGIAGDTLTFILLTPIVSLMGLFTPSIQGLMSQKIGPKDQGQLQGANACLAGISGMIGPALFTEAFNIGLTRDGTFAIGLPFFIASSLLLLAIIIVRISSGARDPLPPFALRK